MKPVLDGSGLPGCGSSDTDGVRGLQLDVAQLILDLVRSHLIENHQ
jgi:hypothetical protein